MKIIFFGDIVGSAGRQAIKEAMPFLNKKYNPDIYIANCENASGGIGITPKTAEELFSMGINLLSSGNHVWKHNDINTYLNNTNKLIRPLNYPNVYNLPGFGYCKYTYKDNNIILINLQGRVFMDPIDCPFLSIDNLLEKIDKEKYININSNNSNNNNNNKDTKDLKESKDNAINKNIIIVDFHAEATSEKIAMAYYLDGRVSAVLGTHTHVQTADEKILPNKTAYISDIGMCGSASSVIGVDKNIIIERLISLRPVKFHFSKEDPYVNAVFLDIDKDAKANKIERILY
jgi:2',3'-cyclic-nucleotide 2'-phosphodiesterase